MLYIVLIIYFIANIIVAIWLGKKSFETIFLCVSIGSLTVLSVYIVDYWKDILRFLMCIVIYLVLITPAVLLIKPNNTSPLFVGAFLLVFMQVLIFSTFVVVWANDWYLRKFGTQIH